MADAPNKYLGLSIRVDQAEVEDQLKGLKKIVQDAFKGGVSIDASVKEVAREVNKVAEEMKQIKRNLKAYYKAQDEDLAREEVAIAKRVSKELTDIQKARYAQAAQINKQMTASGYYKTLDEFARANDKVVSSNQRLQQSHKQTLADFLNLHSGLKGYIRDVETLILAQARWYGAKAVLFGTVGAVKTGFDYTVEIDKARAMLLRYQAMEGEVTAQHRANVEQVTTYARQLSVKLPVAFNEVAQAADRLLAAGTDIEMVKGSLKSFAELKVAFPEINAEKFTNSVVGFLNTFKSTPGLKELGNDAERLTAILDKTTIALAKSVMAPADLPALIQHLGQMSQAAGFSIDQMMALAAMVTNLGSKAGPAGRAMRGLIDSFSSPKGINALNNQLGITLDKSQSLASQLPKIVEGLRKAVGTGEGTGLSLGAMEFLRQIAPTERRSALIALLREFEKYKELVDAISNSQGALSRTAAEMTNSLGGQIDILKNVAKELGKVIIDSQLFKDGIVDSLLKSLVDVAQGALYAVNPTMTMADSVKNLGDAGKLTYAVISDVTSILQTMVAAIAPIIKGLVSLAGGVVQCQTALVMLANIMLARFTITALAPVIGGLMAVYKTLKDLVLISMAEGGVRFALQYMGSAFTGLVNPLNLAIVAVAGFLTILTKYQQKLRDIQSDLNGFGSQLKDMNYTTLQQEEVKIEKEIEALEAKKARSYKEIGGYLIFGASDQKMLEAAQKKLEWVRGQMVYFETQPGSNTGPDEDNKKANFQSPSGKSYTRSEASAIKEYYRALIQEQKAYADMALRYADDYHKLGILSDKEFYDQKIQNIVTNRDIELKLLEEERAKIEQIYKESVSKTPAQQKALAMKRDADLQQIDSKKMQIVAKAATDVHAAQTQETLRRRNLLIQSYQTELDITKTFIQDKFDALTSGLNVESEYNRYLYETGGTSATAYYDLTRSLILRNTEAKKRALTEEYEATRERQDKEFLAEGTTKERKNQILQEQERDYFAYEAAIAREDRRTQEELVQNQLKAAEDIKHIWENLGASGALGKSFRDIARDYGNMGENIYSSTQSVVQEMESSWGNFFDYTSDRFMDFGNLATDILHEIYNELMKVLVIKPLVSAAASAFGGGGTQYVPGTSGIPLDALYVPSAKGNVFSASGLAPYLNKIVSKPTLFAFAKGIGLMGEAGRDGEAIMPLTRTSSGDLGVRASGNTEIKINVQVINQTGTQAQVNQSVQKVSPDEYILSVVLTAARYNTGGFRDIMMGGK
jgi:TP901 family phage tail tape measure protein/lambda family phage tail tape measure protein